MAPELVVGNFVICCRSDTSSPAKPFISNSMKLELQLPFLHLVMASPGRIHGREKMLKITRAANGGVVFTVSGRLEAENLAELKTRFCAEASGRHIALDLKELTLVDQDAFSFLMRCEADNIELKNCPAYIREW